MFLNSNSYYLFCFFKFENPKLIYFKFFRAVNNKCFSIKNWNEEMIYFLVWIISVCEILFCKSFYEFVNLN